MFPLQSLTWKVAWSKGIGSSAILAGITENHRRRNFAMAQAPAVPALPRAIRTGLYGYCGDEIARHVCTTYARMQDTAPHSPFIAALLLIEQTTFTTKVHVVDLQTTQTGFSAALDEATHRKLAHTLQGQDMISMRIPVLDEGKGYNKKEKTRDAAIIDSRLG
ncbi:hypothetical protein CSIM01_08827 [Colletotrichum simmondsii]|uniref:Uncharacterized protein n=1 Tax=Colletotrichum simmondsii TaxID=703756 RepID=A0A135TZJ5_9PEZI|nr:hypothetical protein CSIM01_08827 [Colletotrichum simmondsii]